jgi:hypothetical protein
MRCRIELSSAVIRPATLLSAGGIGREVGRASLSRAPSRSSKLPKLLRREMSSTNDPKRIHLLGLGNLAKLFAHTIRKAHPTTPITLLFHRESQFEEWDKENKSIGIGGNDGSMDKSSGYDVELVGDVEANAPITNLILATKTFGTVNALMPLKKRLGTDTTILFIQNGMGL